MPDATCQMLQVRYRVLLLNIGLLRGCSEAMLQRMAQFFTTEFYARDDVVIQEGDYGSEMYVLVQGTVGVLHGSGAVVVEDSVAGEGSCFGELALLTKSQQRRQHSIVAKTFLTVACLARADFETFIGLFPDDRRNLLINCLLQHDITTEDAQDYDVEGISAENIEDKLKEIFHSIFTSAGQEHYGDQGVICGHAMAPCVKSNGNLSQNKVEELVQKLYTGGEVDFRSFCQLALGDMAARFPSVVARKLQRPNAAPVITTLKIL